MPWLHTLTLVRSFILLNMNRFHYQRRHNACLAWLISANDFIFKTWTCRCCISIWYHCLWEWKICFVCLFVSLLSHFSHFWLFFAYTCFFTNHMKALSSYICSITPETTKVRSSYSHMRTTYRLLIISCISVGKMKHLNLNLTIFELMVVSLHMLQEQNARKHIALENYISVFG